MGNIKQQTRQNPAAEAAPRQSEAPPDDASKETGNAPRRGGPAISHVARQPGNAMQQATGQAEEAGRKMSEVVQQGIAGIRTFMALPAAAGGGLIEMQQAMAGLVGSIVQANLRLAQGLLQAADPGTVIDLQRRCMREHAGAFTESGFSVVHAACHTAEKALRPLEAHLEQRRRWQDSQPGQQHSRRVADVMSPSVRVANPEDTVQQAARIMREEDTGVLPVGEDDRLIGMVTDHDIAALVAEARDPAHTKVREVMVPEVRYVFEDEDSYHAAANMAEQHVGRLPVLSRRKRLVGIVSLGDLEAEGQSPAHAAQAAGRRASSDARGGVAAE
jgi:CBS domain-containing protein